MFASLFLLGVTIAAKHTVLRKAHPVTTTYTGTFPCADCTGVVRTITLTKAHPMAKSGTFVEHDLYQGKMTSPIVTTGTWTLTTGAPFDPNAEVFKLQEENESVQSLYWMKNDTTIELLDTNGQKIDSPFNNDLTAIHTRTDKQTSTLANPASENCAKVGGTLVLQQRGDGGSYGLCMFEDNMACEEWALYRGQCPVGGVKTTGYDTVDQRYCAWLGGQTVAEENASCTLPSGNVCRDDALYNGTCQP